jgi:hypothetical protein
MEVNALPLRRILLALFLVCAGAIWIKSLYVIGMAGDTSHPESAIIQTAWLASQSGRLYPSLDAPPYTPAPYGPLFYAMLAGAGRFCRGDILALRLLLRLMVFASYAIVGLMGYMLARNCGASRSAAMLGAVAIWAAPQVLYWDVSVRPDFPGLFFSLLGLWILSRRVSPDFPSTILSGVCCAGAVLIKQGFVAAPLAIALLFALRRSYRYLAVFTASGLLVALPVIGYLQFHGEPVIKEMLLLGYSPVAFRPGISILYSNLSVGLALVVVAGSAVGFVLAFQPAGDWQIRLVAIYLLSTLLVTTGLLVQAGSDSNYLFEFWSVACVLAASAVPQAEAAWIAMSPPVRIGAAIGLLILTARSFDAIRNPERPAVQYSFDRLRGLHILSTDPSLSVRGKSPELLDTFLAAILEQRHVWTPAGILGEIGGEEFDVAFVSVLDRKPLYYHGQPTLSPTVLQSLARFYRPLCYTATMQVLRPQHRAAGYSVADASYTLREDCKPN